MAISIKTARAQMNLLRPFLKNCSLDTLRIGQNKIGELMEFKYRKKVIVKEHSFEHFKGAFVIPKDERHQGVILYLHGGGYTCGNLEYALGFASMLATKSGTRVFCVAYRLAPEFRYPSALDDALEGYLYLIKKGYSPSHITLCGESAGGGLCYSLCLKIREMNLDVPCGIIGISPWTDLSASGKSYQENAESDPSMTVENLRYFAQQYADDHRDPYVSPMFAQLQGMPPSLLFAAKNEILYSDSEDFHQKLLQQGCKSKLVTKEDRWHAYLLYGLEEDVKDFTYINRFLNANMSPEQKLRWMPLDNAAKIYPAARRENWSNVFRLSATLKEEVDKEILHRALDVTLRRFPSIGVKLKKGLFWYYLEQLSSVPDIMEESSYPLTKMSKRETGTCALRVIVYQKRIAVEIFHSLTDGTGALVFLKSLLAEYLQQKYNLYIPAQKGVLGRLEEPSEEELEDSFQKYSGKLQASRKERTAWHLGGTPEVRNFQNITCFKIPVEQVHAMARERGVSVTIFMTAAMMQALQNLQKEKVANQNHRKPIKVLIPVNLRKLFPSRSLRNFALYTTPEILPKLGEYSFEEICQVIKSKMDTDITVKNMSMMIATNIGSERLMAVRIMPLFVKNFVMKAVFDSVGEKKSCLSVSNLGVVALPEVMTPYIERFDFILGVQAKAPYNCGMISYGDTLYVNFIRNIKEADLEFHFYEVLRTMGVCVEVESNRTSK